ncbi:MAG: hypothetical protein M3O46_21455 [Myxococcota bacterium]|nr:hypothetical protein [Myxococcota bacterium]
MTPTDSRSIVMALAAFIDERVDEKLAALGVAATEYRSSAPARGTNTRTHNRWCRSGRVPGAYRDGLEWVCSPAAWREARAGTPKRLVARPILVAANDDVDALLSGAGLRPTRRAAR